MVHGGYVEILSRFHGPSHASSTVPPIDVLKKREGAQPGPEGLGRQWNTHFYVNRCGFKIIDFFISHHVNPALSAGHGLTNDEGFLFEKMM